MFATNPSQNFISYLNDSFTLFYDPGNKNMFPFFGNNHFWLDLNTGQ